MAGLDSNTKLLLHCDGTDGSTTFTDSKLISPHTVTANGTAQIDTAIKKFGTGAGMFDGNSDYLTIPDSTDWDIFANGTDDWTLDFWIKHSTNGLNEQYINQYTDNSNRWIIQYDTTPAISCKLRIGGSGNDLSSGAITLGQTWHHIAMIKIGANWGIYIDGTQLGYTLLTNFGTLSHSVEIGRALATNYFEGHMDEIRIQKSNYFSASPNSGKTDTITVPTVAYSYEAPPTISTFNQVIFIT